MLFLTEVDIYDACCGLNNRLIVPEHNVHMPLEDSWVVEGGDDDVRHEGSETSVKQEEYVIPRQDRKQDTKATRRPKRTTRSPDPEFIMPSLDYRAVDGSWEGLSSRDSRSEGSRQRRKSSTDRKSVV